MISKELEKDYRNKFVAIEVNSGDYFISDTSVSATKKAREKYPDKVFFLGRIGYRAAVSKQHYHRRCQNYRHAGRRSVGHSGGLRFLAQFNLLERVHGEQCEGDTRDSSE